MIASRVLTAEVPPAHLSTVRLSLPDGLATTAHVATYSLADTEVAVRRLPDLTPLGAWCASEQVDEALVGGFYLREPQAPSDASLIGTPLGELRLAGVEQPFEPFMDPWGAVRACVHVAGGAVRIARRDEFPAEPEGDLLQAGPLLLRDGEIVTGDDEGFSAGAGQFDSDITVGRHPRAALGCDGTRVIALACDGRDDTEAGLTLSELAQALVELGARDALNLDGGGSTALVCGGMLRNIPREVHGLPVPGGRAIATALVFTARS